MKDIKMNKLRLLRERITVKRENEKEVEVTSTSNIIILGTIPNQTDVVTVTNVSSNIFDIKIGDKLLIGKYAAHPYTIDKEEILVINRDDIIGIMNGLDVQPLDDWIIIRWMDTFKEESEFKRSGLVIQRKLERTRGNWAKVIAIGPKVQHVKVGEFVLPTQTYKQFSEYPNEVEGGMVSLTGEPTGPFVIYYKTKEEWCPLVSDDIAATYELNSENTVQIQEDIWADDFRLKVAKKEK